MARFIAAGAIFLTTVAALGVAAVALGAPDSQAGPALNLIAGQGDGVISMNGFVADPAHGFAGARVAVGTTVTWTVGSDEAHTVSFLAGGPRPPLMVPQPEDPMLPPMLNPAVFFPSPTMGPWDGTTYINSSPISRGQEFSVTFSQPGRYEYVCLLHDPMAGSIEVVQPGTAGITTQATVDGFAATHMPTAHQPQIDRIFAERNVAAMLAGPRGTSIWTARAGTDWRYGHLDIMAFLPGDLTVRQGDTVVWTVDHGAPHTVTFVPEGTPHPEEFVVQLPDGTILSLEMMMHMGPPPDAEMMEMGPPDPSMLPRLIPGPGLMPAGTGSFDGKGLFNSGMIGYFGNEAIGPSSYALTFDAPPGTYKYICIFHHSIGMEGTVTITAR